MKRIGEILSKCYGSLCCSVPKTFVSFGSSTSSKRVKGGGAVWKERSVRQIGILSQFSFPDHYGGNGDGEDRLRCELWWIKG